MYLEKIPQRTVYIDQFFWFYCIHLYFVYFQDYYSLNYEFVLLFSKARKQPQVSFPASQCIGSSVNETSTVYWRLFWLMEAPWFRVSLFLYCLKITMFGMKITPDVIGLESQIPCILLWKDELVLILWKVKRGDLGLKGAESSNVGLFPLQGFPPLPTGSWVHLGNHCPSARAAVARRKPGLCLAWRGCSPGYGELLYSCAKIISTPALHVPSVSSCALCTVSVLGARILALSTESSTSWS